MAGSVAVGHVVVWYCCLRVVLHERMLVLGSAGLAPVLPYSCHVSLVLKALWKGCSGAWIPISKSNTAVQAWL